MKKERIRLYGIDTPESRTRDKEEKKYGLMSKDAVLSYLPVDSIQTLRTQKDKTGKFGRILGSFVIYDAFKDRQTTLNEWMVENHLAVAYHGQSKNDIEDEHLENRKLVEWHQN